MTLTPQSGPPAFAPSLCILCGEMAVQDIILNVILFVPFGVGLRLAGVRRARVIATAFCLTTAIELLQMHVIPGRDASLGDVITNTLGGVVGITLADSWHIWLLPTAQQARRLLCGGIVVWVAILAATVWALHRSLPDSTLWGQWDPAILHFDRFSGTVVKSDAAGFAFPPGARGSDPVFRRRLVSDSVLVSATVLPGTPTERTAPILSVYDPERTQIFLLAQRQRALVFSIRMNAARAMVRNPIIGLDDVFPASANARIANDTLHVAGGISGNALVIRATDDARRVTRERRIALGPALAWTFFLPWPYAFGGETALLSALWIGGLFLPLGYWARRARRPLESSAALGIAAIAGLLIAPLVLGGAFAGWVEWAGVAVGLTLGASIGGWRASRAARRPARASSRLRQTPVART